MEKIKFFSKKFLKTPAFITMFLLAFVLISFGAKSLIAALNGNDSNTSSYTVTFPTNLEGICENGMQYAISKKSTQFIGSYEKYDNWQSTAGTNSIKIENSDKIKFLIKFDEGYSNLKVGDIKLLDNGLNDSPFSLKVYDYDNNGMLTERDPKENELIIPGKNYPTSELKVTKNLNLSFSGIKADNYKINISMTENPQKTKDFLNVYYYFSNELEKKKMSFSENSNSYELNDLAYNSGINLIFEMSEPYNQTKLNLEDIEGIGDFINKSQTESGLKLNTAINKNYDIKINKTPEKNTYDVKNNTQNTLEYKLSTENEYKKLENEDSFTATHGENYDFKYENLEKTLISNNNILHKNDYVYSLYNISENTVLTSINELAKTNVPIYLPAQENGIFIVDESGTNQITNPSVKYGTSFSFRLKQVEGYTQYFDNIEVYKNNILENNKTLLTPNSNITKDDCSGLYTITDIKQPVKIETSQPIKNIYEISVAQNLKNAKVEVSGQNIKLDESTQNLGTKVYDVEDGSNLEITVTPNDGYNTNNMTLDMDSDTSPNVSLENNTFTVSSIKSDSTLSVRNIQETITIRFSAGMEYTNATNGSQTISKGENFSFKLKDGLKDENFIVKSNNVQLTKNIDGNYAISNIQENQLITVEPDKSKNVTVAIDKNNISDDTSIKINDQDINNVNSLEVPMDSDVTIQKNTGEDLNLSIKSSTEEITPSFDGSNQYTVRNVKSPLTVSLSKGANNENDGRIDAWSLAKTYKFGAAEDNQIKDYSIKFNSQPTDIRGSRAESVESDNDTYTVQFIRKERSDQEDETCQGWSDNNESYFGPKKLNISLNYGNINNEKNFLGFRVDGKRRNPNNTDEFITDKDIFNFSGTHNAETDNRAIKNNVNQTANNGYQNGCSYQQSGDVYSTRFPSRNFLVVHMIDFYWRFKPWYPVATATRYLATPKMFKEQTNSFATMFEFFDPYTILRNTNESPLTTRNIYAQEDHHRYINPPYTRWGATFDDYWPETIDTALIRAEQPSFSQYPLYGLNEYVDKVSTYFNSLFISQNLSFDRENQNKQNLVEGNLEYNIQSKYVNNINNTTFYSYYNEPDTCLYNSRFFNNIHGPNINYYSIYDYKNYTYRMPSGEEGKFSDYYGYYNFYYPAKQYLGTELNANNYTKNMATTSSYDANGRNIENVNFVYLYDEITLIPMFDNAQYSQEATVELPLDTEGVEFYETFKDESGNIQKAGPVTQNRYTVHPEGDNPSAEFNFIVKIKKDYDFNENSVKVYPEGFAIVNHNGEEDSFVDDDGNICYIYKIDKIYSSNIKIGISKLEKHEYTIKCNRYSSNFYDSNDGEKFLTKKIKAGENFTFETEAQTGYSIDSEVLTVSYGSGETVINDQNVYDLPDGGKIKRITNSQSLKNIYEITNLNSDLTLNASRTKRKLDITFMRNDTAFNYADSNGTPFIETLQPNPGDNQDPQKRPYVGEDYFIIEKDYGTNLNFMIKTKDGYDSTTMVATANGAAIEYVNGQYKVKSITENTVIKVESIEKIKCKLVFTQHEGIKFKDEKDNVLTSENELKYGDNFTFKTELSDSYSKSNDYKLRLEYSSGHTVDMVSHQNNPNIFTIENIKENCRIYVIGLEYKKHDIKLYTSEGVTFKDKYGNDKLQSTSNSEYIKQQALHGQSFSFKVVANDGYDISGMKLFAKKDTTGTRQQLFPSNDVYTIENITEDYTVTLEKVEKTKYSVEIRLTDGVKCVDKNGDTMKTNLTVSHGDDLSFYLSLDSAYSKASPVVTVKGDSNPIMPDFSGKYTLNSISGNKIIEISGVKKNTYKATFVGAEGVIYKNNKNKPFENSLDVEYGESLYFKITLMDAYDKSTPLVMMNDNKVIAESAGIYTVSNINNDITITVKNVTKNPEEVTMDDVNNVPDPVITDDDVNSVVKATLTYENLSDEEKEQVTNLAALKKAQKEAGELNHKSGNIYVNGLDWNIKVIATELTKDEEKVNYLNSKIDRRELINLYDIYLLNLLTGKTYELPYGQSVDVTMPEPPALTGYQNIVVAHEKSSGNMEYLDINITDNTVKFTATSFSLFGLAAKKTPNYSENPSSTHISVSGLVDNEEELKTLLGEGAVSQIGDLTQPDDSLTSTENQNGSSESDTKSMSWWQKFYKWALNNEFLIVLLILLLGSGTIWLLISLAKRHQQSE